MLSLEEFRDEIWKNIDIEIRKSLQSPCKFNLIFKQQIDRDGDKIYYLSFERKKKLNWNTVVGNNSELIYNLMTPEVNIERRVKKIDTTLTTSIPCIKNILYYENSLRNIPMSNSKYYNFKTYYCSSLLTIYFYPINLTQKNAERIGKSIYFV